MARDAQERFTFNFVTRPLAQLGGDSSDYVDALKVLCIDRGLANSEVSKDQIWEWFDAGFPKVRHPGLSRDWPQWAYERSQEQLIPFPAGVTGVITQTRRMVYSMCRYLALERRGRPFNISRERFGKILNMRPTSISHIVKWMFENGLIIALNKDGKPVEDLKEQHWCWRKPGEKHRTRLAAYLIPGDDVVPDDAPF